ncbi:hypothetical protein ACFOHW_08870 [Paenibacillus abyssi]|uniref:hypothetical protein n=1 Tax=Paenibacillus abyssi TaxID=1340531 RepID=UPI003618AB44
MNKGEASFVHRIYHEQLTLPMDLQEDIPENHLVRVINDAVNRLPMKIFTPA